MGPLVLSRRSFLAGIGASLVVASCSKDGAPSGSRQAVVPDLARDPFTLGVASGDPLADRVILWTRLAPEPRRGGGMPDTDVTVEWEVATDERFEDVAARGEAVAPKDLAHSVHVDAEGLDPDRWYHYRFRVGDHTSPVGRTRTLPEPDASPDRVRFAVASCQDYQEGFYTAYPHLLEEDVDLVFFLGDYIYEDEGGRGDVRQYTGAEPLSLVDYRDRYAIYKSDEHLRAAHAAFPWVVVWDDHEVENNYAGTVAQDPVPEDQFRERRRAAYQAWYEHQPVRLDWDDDEDPAIYRSMAFGDLAAFYALDTRQYRTDQPCEAPSDLSGPCPGMSAEDATLLGAAQEEWLLGELEGSETTWNVLAQQVVFAAARFAGAGLELFNVDQWDGYRAARQRIIDAFRDLEVSNPVVLCGDIHTSVVADIQADPTDFGSEVVGTEFGGTSITSTFPEAYADLAVAAIAGSPDVKYFNPELHGYVVCEATPERMTADYRLVRTTLRRESEIAETSSWRVEAGRPGVKPA